jgi:hypothetical protein
VGGDRRTPPDAHLPAALADRTAELSELPEVEQVFCFESRGVEIGVTLHQAPTHHPGRNLAGLHLQLASPLRAAGKLKFLAGSESAMGVFINDVRPEQAAQMLRETVS